MSETGQAARKSGSTDNLPGAKILTSADLYPTNSDIQDISGGFATTA
jgi:hypothetical protein